MKLPLGQTNKTAISSFGIGCAFLMQLVLLYATAHALSGGSTQLNWTLCSIYFMHRDMQAPTRRPALLDHTLSYHTVRAHDIWCHMLLDVTVHLV